jgi:hypothetical protein
MDKMIAGTIEIVDLRQVCKFLGMVTVLMNGLSSHGLVFRIPLNGLTLPHFCACPKPGPGFPTFYVMTVFFVFTELRREVIC